MSLAPLTYRVYAADAVVRGRSPEVQLSAVLSSDGHGSLRAAAWGTEPVLVDSRNGPPQWSPDAPPQPWLAAVGSVLLPEGRAVLYPSFQGEVLVVVLEGGSTALLPAAFSLPRVLQIGSQLAAGLAWLHAQGRVHNGLTPHHILVGRDDAVAILGLNHARQVAREHAEGVDERRSDASLAYLAFVAHWTHPWRESVVGLEDAVRSARRVGDVTFLPGAMQFLAQIKLLLGADLKETLRLTRSHAEELHFDTHNQHRVQAHAALAEVLCEPRPVGTALLDGFAGLEHAEDQFTSAQLYALRAIASYLMGDLAQARVEFDRTRPLENGLFCLPLTPAYKGYDAMSALQSAMDGTATQRRRALALARKHRRYIAPRADASPENLRHRVSMIDAEMAMLRGDDATAIRHFVEAVERAERGGFQLDHALALTRLAACHRRAGRLLAASSATEAARVLMLACGAVAWAQTLPSPDGNERAVVLLDGVDIDVDTLVRAGIAIGSELHLDLLLPRLTALVQQNAGAQRAVIVTQVDGEWRIEAEEGSDGYRRLEMPLEQGGELLCLSIVRYALRSGQSVQVDDAGARDEYREDAYVQRTGARSMLAIPMRRGNETSGLLFLEHRLSGATFDPARVRGVHLLAAQIGIALANARLFAETEGLKVASERFVPKQMLEVLGKRDIREVNLGDSVEGNMTVLFADIRSFTTLSEGLSPQETFAFINRYLHRMEPLIRQNGGFIDKYIGDAIMAVFPNAPDDAVRAATQMLQALADYNAEQAQSGVAPLEIGVGIHTGPLMLGTVGGASRMEGTVIGDTVNLASRVEALTKTSPVSLLVTETTVRALRHPAAVTLVRQGTFDVRGRGEPVVLYALAD